MKRTGIATFAAALLISATAFAADPHHDRGGGAPHGGAPHMGGGGAPHMGGGGAPAFHGGGFHGAPGGFARSAPSVPHNGGMASFSAAPSHNFSAPRGGMANYSHAGPGREFSAPRGGFVHNGRAFEAAPQGHAFNGGMGGPRGYASYRHGGETFRNGATMNTNTRDLGEPRGYGSFHHGSGSFRNGATMNTNARGMGAPRGGANTEASYMHREGRYGSMEHGNVVAQPNGQTGHYGRDARGYGMRPRNWNQRPRNFDRGAYQRDVTAGERFHYGAYDRPRGWYYRRWSYSDYLPQMFWARDYWLTDWWMFDLPIPPYGYEWVRYGDDAILVNVYTGQILQVDYGVFY